MDAENPYALFARGIVELYSFKPILAKTSFELSKELTIDSSLLNTLEYLIQITDVLSLNFQSIIS